MTDRPIIFSAPMVRALLAGRKTQTRRILKPQPGNGATHFKSGTGKHVWDWPGLGFGSDSGRELPRVPFSRGDRLWVREAFVTGFNLDEEGRQTGKRKVWYRATDNRLTWYDPDTESTLDNPPWKPSIHMPRWASRLTLHVTEVRVQRLQEISEADAVAEGCECDTDGWRDYQAPATQCCVTARESYRTLWNSLHGPDAWAQNPWCVAISFSVQKGNIDAL